MQDHGGNVSEDEDTAISKEDTAQVGLFPHVERGNESGTTSISEPPLGHHPRCEFCILICNLNSLTTSTTVYESIPQTGDAFTTCLDNIVVAAGAKAYLTLRFGGTLDRSSPDVREPADNYLSR